MLSRGPQEADSHSVRTLHQRGERKGRRVALDRTWLEVREDGRAFIVRRDGEIAVHGRTLDHSARISARGRFRDPDTLFVEEIHEHAGASEGA